MVRDTAHSIRKSIRHLLSHSPSWRETKDASAGSVELSYQSLILPERHIWIETSIEMFGSLIIDLEDWNDDTHWDNSVIHLGSYDPVIIAKIARAWLGGESLDFCRSLGGFVVDLK